jgi:hypothetical protein
VADSAGDLGGVDPDRGQQGDAGVHGGAVRARRSRSRRDAAGGLDGPGAEACRQPIMAFASRLAGWPVRHVRLPHRWQPPADQSAGPAAPGSTSCLRVFSADPSQSGGPSLWPRGSPCGHRVTGSSAAGLPETGPGGGPDPGSDWEVFWEHLGNFRGAPLRFLPGLGTDLGSFLGSPRRTLRP